MSFTATSNASGLLAGVLLMALGAFARPAAGQSFGPAATYATGANASPYGVALGDVNGDGWPDIVTAGGNLNAVSVVLGLASGGFAAATAYSSGPASNPLDVALGDVNGDGRLDIVTASTGLNAAGVLLGQVVGGFAAPTHYSVGPRSFPVKVKLGDVNGDGRLDVVTVNYGSNTIGVLLGQAGGGFAAVSNYACNYATGPSSGPRDLALGDVNGDGRLDIVTANGDADAVGVLLGLAGGGFAAAATYSTGANSAPNAVALADVNRDGRPDLVTASTGLHSVGVLLGQASGFAAVSSYAAGPNGTPVTVALADVNGDGRPDIMTTAADTKTAGVLLGAASGFAPAVAFSAGLTSDPQALALGDVNGDGRPDIVTANLYLGSVGVLLNTGTYTPLAAARPTAADVALAPNPAHDAFAVALPAGWLPTQAELLNSLGQVVRRPATAAGRFTVETAGLAPGLYTLRLGTGGATLARRVVVE